MLKVGSLFSGIAGLDLGLERAGMKIQWFCENNPFCRRVLKKRYPRTICFTDVKYIQPTKFCKSIDVLAGGFPCQPVSLAGKRNGYLDPRWLWPEFYRCIEILKPKYVLIENVEGLKTYGLSAILTDLATEGYDAEWDCLPASILGAPHIRKRYFIVGYPSGYVRDEGTAIFDFEKFKEWAFSYINSDSSCTGSQSGDTYRLKRRRDITINTDGPLGGYGWWETEPRVGRVVNGSPVRLDRLRALANAVVPQLAEYVGYSLIEFHKSFS